MEAHIQKWRNSLGLRIPMQFAKQEIEDHKIIIQSQKKIVREISPKNQHHQIIDDEQQGNEDGKIYMITVIRLHVRLEPDPRKHVFQTKNV